MSTENQARLDIRRGDIATGIKLPFVGRNGNLFDLSYTTQEQALSNLKNLLLTRKGERLYEPLFGTDIYDSLFEANTEELRRKISLSIENAIGYWLPYIKIVKLVVDQVIVSDSNIEEHGIQISLLVSVSNFGANVPVTFLLTSNGMQVI